MNRKGFVCRCGGAMICRKKRDAAPNVAVRYRYCSRCGESIRTEEREVPKRRAGKVKV